MTRRVIATIFLLAPMAAQAQGLPIDFDPDPFPVAAAQVPAQPVVETTRHRTVRIEGRTILLGDATVRPIAGPETTGGASTPGS